MQDIAITLIQADLAWEDIPTNLSRFDIEIDKIEGSTDLIVLPEMFSTGFSMNADELAEPMDGKAVTWLKHKAIQRQTVITGSVMVIDGDRFYNRLVWARPDGSLTTYDKKHLFRYAGEEKTYSAGDQRTTVDLKGWSIRPFICYDLRFPMWTRNLNRVYDLAIYVANWPAKRALHWQTLLKARAIENQAYVAAVNRVGKDGNGFDYSGHSAVIDPTGRLVFEQEKVPCTTTIRLSYETMQTYRKEFPAWMDADGDMVK